MEVDCGPVMLTVSIATSRSFYLFNLGIKCLGKGIGYPVFQICQDVVQMPLYRLGRFNDWTQSGVCSPEAFLEEFQSPSHS